MCCGFSCPGCGGGGWIEADALLCALMESGYANVIAGRASSYPCSEDEGLLASECLDVSSDVPAKLSKNWVLWRIPAGGALATAAAQGAIAMALFF